MAMEGERASASAARIAAPTARNTKRRGPGEGGVYQRRNGLWCGSVELSRDMSGRRQRKIVTAKTKTELFKKLKAVRRRVDSGQPVTDGTQTVGAYLDWWIENVAPSTIKPSTVNDYRFVLKRYVKPHVGHITLSKLTPQHIRTMLHKLETSSRIVGKGKMQREVVGYSARTRQYARSVLRRALKHAERDGLVTRNVVTLVDGPRVSRTKLDDTLSVNEVRRVLDTVRGDRLEALAKLVLRLGLRKGEVTALRWSDIDFDVAQISVRGTLKYVDGALTVDAPKTAAAERTIPLIGDLVDVLKAHRARQARERLAAGRNWIDSGYVFSMTDGRPLNPTTLHVWWKGLTKRADVGDRRFHATRHTAATMLLDEGVALEVVSAILGHASIKITADVYARVTQDAKRRALAALDRVFSPAP